MNIDTKQALFAEKGVVDSIARDLCAFFHQESVLITESKVRAYYIKEELPK